MLMEESTTYQAILEEGHSKGLTQGLSQGLTQGLSQGLNQGRCDGLRSVILRQGTKRFGPPPAVIAKELQSRTDMGQLELLVERILDAGGWDDLFAGA